LTRRHNKILKKHFATEKSLERGREPINGLHFFLNQEELKLLPTAAAAATTTTTILTITAVIVIVIMIMIMINSERHAQKCVGSKEYEEYKRRKGEKIIFQFIIPNF